MNNRRRFIRFKNPETQIIYLALPSNPSRTFPALVQDESRNSMSCIILEESSFADEETLLWLEGGKHQTQISVVRLETIAQGVHKIIFQFD